MARDVISRAFARIGRLHGVILVIYAAVVPAAIVVATRIPSQGAIDQLIVPGDPDIAATRGFHAIFPEPQQVLLVLESPDPWSASTIERVDRTTRAVATVPHVAAFSVLDALRRAHPGADVPTMRSLATGTDLFRRQGLVGDHFMTVFASLDVDGPAARDAALQAIDRAVDDAGVEPVHRVGAPYVTSWLEHQSAAATTKAFAMFGVLLLVITWLLYRSLRTLVAIVVALGSAVALAMAAGAVLGFAFTIVSSLVPLTVMVTTLATLTYLQSRFIDHGDDLPIRDHQVVALRNKFLPVTASTVAAAMGFAALAVSKIQPIREMGEWTAVGLVVSWLVAFTLFPALQLGLRTPTTRRVRVRSATYERVAGVLPRLTFRYRRAIVAVAVVTTVTAAVAVFGVPGVIGGMPIQVDTLSNLDPATGLARDLRWFRDHVMDLNVARVWVHLPRPTATDPEVLRALDGLDTAIEIQPSVTAVTGPTTPLRMRSYFAGHGAALPSDPARFDDQVGDVEQLLLAGPELRTFIDANGLADVQLVVLFRGGDAAGYAALDRRIHAVWDGVRAATPALAGADMHVVGESLLQVKVGASLVPTLAESLAITVGFILVVFLIVFRSGIERLLAMIPSVVALLATFLGMRLFGGSLNIATIIIATTVVGTTEADQLHFFHHMHERAGAPLDERLHHTLRVSGRAIVFATMVNAIGFLALATSSFPPLRQFGLMTASAFVLAMVADFTVLPAALWIVSRHRHTG